jgi:hypothetical protein
MASLARTYFDKGLHNKSESLLRKGIDIIRRRSLRDTSQLEDFLIQLAHVYCAQDMWDDAELTLLHLVRLKTCKNVQAFYILVSVSLPHAQSEKYYASYTTPKTVA